MKTQSAYLSVLFCILNVFHRLMFQGKVLKKALSAFAGRSLRDKSNLNGVPEWEIEKSRHEEFLSSR